MNEPAESILRKLAASECASLCHCEGVVQEWWIEQGDALDESELAYLVALTEVLG